MLTATCRLLVIPLCALTLYLTYCQRLKSNTVTTSIFNLRHDRESLAATSELCACFARVKIWFRYQHTAGVGISSVRSTKYPPPCTTDLRGVSRYLLMRTRRSLGPTTSQSQRPKLRKTSSKNENEPHSITTPVNCQKCGSIGVDNVYCQECYSEQQRPSRIQKFVR